MTFKRCLNPPNALELRAFAFEELNKKARQLDGGRKFSQFQKLAEEMEKRLPRKNFMIDLICQLNPKHEIFKKDYKPPVSESLIEKAGD